MESKVCSSWPSSVILPSNFSQFGLILHEKLCFSTLFLPLFTWIKLCIMISGSSTMWYSNRPLIVYHHLDFKMIKSYHIPQQKTTQYATKTRSSIRLAPYIDIDSFYTISLVVGNSTFFWTFHPWGSDQNLTTAIFFQMAWWKPTNEWWNMNPKNTHLQEQLRNWQFVFWLETVVHPLWDQSFSLPPFWKHPPSTHRLSQVPCTLWHPRPYVFLGGFEDGRFRLQDFGDSQPEGFTQIHRVFSIKVSRFSCELLVKDNLVHLIFTHFVWMWLEI